MALYVHKFKPILLFIIYLIRSNDSQSLKYVELDDEAEKNEMTMTKKFRQAPFLTRPSLPLFTLVLR